MGRLLKGNEHAGEISFTKICGSPLPRSMLHFKHTSIELGKNFHNLEFRGICGWAGKVEEKLGGTEISG